MFTQPGKGALGAKPDEDGKCGGKYQGVRRLCCRMWARNKEDSPLADMEEEGEKKRSAGARDATRRATRDSIRCADARLSTRTLPVSTTNYDGRRDESNECRNKFALRLVYELTEEDARKSSMYLAQFIIHMYLHQQSFEPHDNY